MNLNFIDWVIVLLVLVGMFYSVSLTSGLMKSVSDFLSAGRTVVDISWRYLVELPELEQFQ